MDSHASVPLIAIGVSTINACLLVLINIGSTTAFQDVVSLVLSCFYASYLIACSLLLYRRCTGAIQSTPQNSTLSDEAGAPLCLTWGSWRVPGVLGVINNSIACAYLVILLFFSFWPASRLVSAGDMNYSIAVTGFVVLFSVLYYAFWARKFYTGPVVEIRSDKR